MSFAKLELVLGQLNQIYVNLKKAPNRTRTPIKAEEKLQQIGDLFEAFSNLFEEVDQNKISELERIALKRLGTEANRYKNDSEDIVNRNIRSVSPDLEEHKEEKIKSQTVSQTDTMSGEEFSFSTAQKLPTLSFEENTRSESLRDFLNSIEFYYDTLTTTAKGTLIKFVLKCKIQGKALTELGNTSPKDFTELKKSLLEKCGPKDTIEQIQSRLSRATQGNRPVREFITEIETLVNRMTELEVACHGEETRATLTTANDRRGLAFLKRGVNDRLKLVLDSARHTTLKSASQHLLEIDQGSTQPATLKYFGERQQNFRGYQARGSNSRGREIRGDRHVNNSYQPSYQNYNLNPNHNHRMSPQHIQNNSRTQYRAGSQNSQFNTYNRSGYQNRQNNNYRQGNQMDYNQQGHQPQANLPVRTNVPHNNCQTNYQPRHNRENRQRINYPSLRVLGNEQPTEGTADPSEGSL